MQKLRSDYFLKCTVCWLIIFLCPLLCANRALASVSIVANGRCAYESTVTDLVRRSAVRDMLIDGVKKVLAKKVPTEDQETITGYVNQVVTPNINTYVEDYSLLAELQSKGYFEVTGSVLINDAKLLQDLQKFKLERSSNQPRESVLFLITEYHERDDSWRYWWKIPPDKKAKSLPFTEALGEGLERSGIWVIDKIGKEKILLQSSDYQTAFVSLDSAIQLGLVYRTPFVILGNVHLKDSGNLSSRRVELVCSLQIVHTGDGSSVGEITEKKVFKQLPKNRDYRDFAQTVVPKVIALIKSYTANSEKGREVTTASTLQQVPGPYEVKILVSNIESLRPVEEIERYLGQVSSHVQRIKSLVLKHKSAEITVLSEVDGVSLAEYLASAFAGNDEFSVTSSGETEIQITSKYPGIL